MNWLSNTALLDPKGVLALHERDLLVTATYLMLLVVIPVFILTALIAWRYRATNKRAKYLPNWEHNKLEELIWWLIPCIIIAILANMTWKSSHSLDPYQPLVSTQQPISIQVVALNWKWLFLYPEQGIATVNELEIPVNTPIHFFITADAPMNSFWIPDLGGQIYAMPGMQTQLHLMATDLGTYPGVSANFSGKGFAGMKFKTYVVSKEIFDRWVVAVKSSPYILNDSSYTNLTLESTDNVAQYFGMTDSSIFHSVIMKYMSPAVPTTTNHPSMDMMHE